jgi:hypothetical protein
MGHLFGLDRVHKAIAGNKDRYKSLLSLLSTRWYLKVLLDLVTEEILVLMI